MGVSGAGKTLIARALARELGWPFLEGDHFHPQSNVAKMRGGTPLEPVDRVAWLQAMKADRELIRARVAARADHFMPASFVDSQFEALEEPDDALVADASKEPDAIVEAIRRGLALR